MSPPLRCGEILAIAAFIPYLLSFLAASVRLSLTVDDDEEGCACMVRSGLHTVGGCPYPRMAACGRPLESRVTGDR